MLINCIIPFLYLFYVPHSIFIVNKKFLRLRQFNCPVCNAIVKQLTLTDKTADETEVERDTKIRKRLKAIFNKPEIMFPNRLAFHDYEEELEDLVFNLVHGIDEERCNARVEQYRRENADSIPINQSKHIEAERRLRQTIEEERRSADELYQSFAAADRGEKLRKMQDGRKSNTVLLGDVDESLSSTLSLLQQRSVSQAEEEYAEDKRDGALGSGRQGEGEGGSRSDLASLASSASAPGVARGQAQHNSFLQFVGQRPDARESEQAPARASVGLGLDVLRRAGGYDRTRELERNRSELRAAIKCCR